MDCPICKAPGMCICPPKQARVMNILTPAALEAMNYAFNKNIDAELGECLTLTFNAAIAKLIEEGRAKKGKFLNDASEPAFWDDGIFIKGEP